MVVGGVSREQDQEQHQCQRQRAGAPALHAKMPGILANLGHIVVAKRRIPRQR